MMSFETIDMISAMVPGILWGLLPALLLYLHYRYFRSVMTELHDEANRKIAEVERELNRRIGEVSDSLRGVKRPFDSWKEEESCVTGDDENEDDTDNPIKE